MAVLLIPADFVSKEMGTWLTGHKDAQHYFPHPQEQLPPYSVSYIVV